MMLRRAILALLLLLALAEPAIAEADVAQAPESYLAELDLAPIEDFAAKHAPELDLRATAESILKGEAELDGVAELLLQRLAGPAEEILACAARAVGPAALLILLSCTMQGDSARLLLRISLLGVLMDAACISIDAATACLQTASGFSNAAAPALAALMAATGMGNSASIISPAAALAGSIVERLFVSVGMPLCRAALCTACASGFGDGLRLDRLTKLIRRCCAWLVGLGFTLFTALIALEGSMAVKLDGLSLRTAKFAVDSAAPVIGSGMSDAWESYVAGISAARSAVGISGMLMLLLAAAQPVLRSLGSMLLLQLCGAALDIFGEEHAARACEQLSSVSRMTLELSTGAIAIAMILLGSLVFIGQSIAG